MTMPQRLTENAIRQALAGMTGWRRRKQEISRTYAFSGFVSAMAFVNHVAILAEALDHHPDIAIRHRTVTLTLSTHSAGGLTDLDFALAKKIDS